MKAEVGTEWHAIGAEFFGPAKVVMADERNVRIQWVNYPKEPIKNVESYKFYESFRPVLKPVDAVPPATDRYPHSCPRCNAPAFIGFSSIDCSARCR